MKRGAIALMTLWIVGTLGCAGGPGRPSAEQPAWVAELSGAEQQARFILAVSSAAPGPTVPDAGAEAARMARQKLAAALSEYAREVLTAFAEDRDDYPSPSEPMCQEFIAALAEDVAAVIVRRAVPQDSWEGPGQKVYVLYRLSLAVVNDEILHRSRASLDYLNPFGAPPEEVTAELGAFLARRLRENLREAARTRTVTEETPTEQRPPAWLEAGRHDTYPPERFLCAIGVGEDQPDAERSARDELGSLIQGTLGRTVSQVAESADEVPLTLNARTLDPRELGFTSADLVAVRAPEHWEDPLTETHYVFAVLDRNTAKIMWEREMADALKKSDSLAASARNQQEAENYAASLKDYLDAFAAARQAVELQLRALTVAAQESGPELREALPGPVLVGLKQELEELLARLAVEKTAGDGQWVPPGMPLREPVQVKVVAGESRKPVGGLPVRLLVAGAGSRSIGRLITDEAGTAEWQLQEPPPAGQGHLLVAEIDLDYLSGDGPVAGLKRPCATFTYELRSRSNTLFAFYVSETVADGSPATPIVTERVKRAMSDKGFRLVEEAEMLKHVRAAELAVDRPEAEVLDAFSPLRESLEPGQFLLVVLGAVKTELTDAIETTEGELFIASCPFRFRLLDPEVAEGNRTILEVEGKGQGAYTDSEVEAVKRAREDAASAVVRQLLGKMEGKLAPEPARSRPMEPRA